MNSWKSVLLRAAGFGFAFGLVCVIAGAIFVWWTNRPPKAKPWNTTAITAEYEYLDTEGDKNNVEFLYTLQNNTDADYRVQDGSNIHVGGDLKDSKSMSFGDDEFLKTDYPLYVPAKSRVRFKLHLAYPAPFKIDSDLPEDTRHDNQTKLAQFAAESFRNLDGFVVLDDVNRYKIELPPGWKERAKEPLRTKALN